MRWDTEARRLVRCAPDVEGSGPDLSRLYEHARWDQAARRWVRRRAVLFSRAVRGGRATLAELTNQAQRWCAEQGYEVVGEHVGARGWREAVADVDDGRADVMVVPSVERLRLRQAGVRADRGRAPGRAAASPAPVCGSTRTARSWRRRPPRREEGSGWSEREADHAGVPADEHQRAAGGHGPSAVRANGRALTQCVDCGTDVWIGPNQRTAAARAPQAVLVLCMACGLIEQQKRGGGTVGNLGGGGGRPRLPG